MPACTPAGLGSKFGPRDNSLVGLRTPRSQPAVGYISTPALLTCTEEPDDVPRSAVPRARLPGLRLGPCPGSSCWRGCCAEHGPTSTERSEPVRRVRAMGDLVVGVLERSGFYLQVALIVVPLLVLSAVLLRVVRRRARAA